MPNARPAAIACAAVAVSLLTACSTANGPTAPSSLTAPTASNAPGPDAAMATLTVRVLTRDSEQPIPNATVLRNESFVAQTDQAGCVRTLVPVGVEFSIDVKADGFVGFGAAATVSAAKAEERWTFYLERAQ